MKNTVLIGILAFACSAAFAQSLDEQIDQAVANQTGQTAAQTSQQQAAAHARNNPGNHQFRVDSLDSRIVTVNGQKYQLVSSNNSDLGHTQSLTFVNPATNDTLQVDRRNGDFDAPTSCWDDTAGRVDGCDYSSSPLKGYQVTSSEQNRGEGTQIVGCEKKNADGTCSYVVEGNSINRGTEAGAKAAKKRGKFLPEDASSTTVAVKQHGITPDNAADIKGGTFQGVKTTPASTFDRTFADQRWNSKTLYGPESYYK